MSDRYNPLLLEPSHLAEHVRQTPAELRKAMLILSARKEIHNREEDNLEVTTAEVLLHYASRQWKGKAPAKYILDALVDGDNRIKIAKDRVRAAAKLVRDAEADVEALRCKRALLPGEQGRHNILLGADTDEARRGSRS